MLERGEEGVELCEVGAVLEFELVDFGDAGSKSPLNGGVYIGDFKCANIVKVQTRLYSLPVLFLYGDLTCSTR